jgi:citrate synthase
MRKKNKLSFWNNNRGVIKTEKGGIVIGEAVYNQGYSMLDDFIGKTSFIQVLILNATGRLPSKELSDWVEAGFICSSYPDARIWCNHVGSLAGTLHTSPIAAVSAGLSASDSLMYGPYSVYKASGFISFAFQKQKEGLSIKELIKEYTQKEHITTKMIPGYSRPLIKGDERVSVLEDYAKKLGFAQGSYLSLAYEVEDYLNNFNGETLNLSGYSGAFMIDQSYSLDEIYRICTLGVTSGVHACYAESFDNPPESFFTLQCEDIDYQGHSPRPVPSK